MCPLHLSWPSDDTGHLSGKEDAEGAQEDIQHMGKVATLLGLLSPISSPVDLARS